MKKICIVVLTVVVCAVPLARLQAQTLPQVSQAAGAESGAQAKSLIRTENDLKSGNWQDLLTSFFQLGLNDLTGANRSLEFKANLFGIKAKADSTLLVDSNYVRQQFTRNFQFNFALKLDTQYRFNAFKAGFTWAIVNRRDSSMLSMIGTAVDILFKKSMDSLQTTLNNYQASLSNANGNFRSEKDSLQYFEAKAAVDKLLETGDPFVSSKLPEKFLAFTNFDPIAYNFRRFDTMYKKELAKLRMQPLLTFSVNGSFNQRPGLFSDVDAELVYLQGLTRKGRNLELDIRAKAMLTDTVINNQKNRLTVNIVGGCNWAVITAKNNIGKSIVEFKPHVEYSAIPRGLLLGEKKEQFTANAELRIRIMDQLWLPLMLKYDLKDHNFLGFLKVSLNMNAFKKAAKP